MIISFEKTSRQNVGRGRFDHSAGSRDVRKQYNPHTEIVRMPSGSIVQISSFKEIDAAPPGLYRALMFAIPVSLVLWSLIGAAAWLLISVFL